MKNCCKTCKYYKKTTQNKKDEGICKSKGSHFNWLVKEWDLCEEFKGKKGK